MSKRPRRGRRKRKLSELEEDDSNDTNANNRNKKQKTNNNDKNEKKIPLQLLDLSEYCCCVCKELSKGKIFQCPNGCPICDKCYPQINPCKCPLCRCVMSRNKPIRCRIAEKTLALRVIKCSYDGCNKELLFGDLNKHESTECEYKPVLCKFNVIGCDWKGLRQKKEQHESECICDQNDILKVVQSLKDQLSTYREFCKKCSGIHSESLWVSTEREFQENSDEFYCDGTELFIKIKSEIHTGNHYKISLQIVVAEDRSHFDEEETFPVDIGVVIEPHGNNECNVMKRLNYTLSRDKMESEWIPLMEPLSEDKYKNMFSGGFEIKIFSFDEEM